MGQNGHENNTPDSGDAYSPEAPSQQFVGYGQPHYPPQSVAYPQPVNARPHQPPKGSRKAWIIGCSIAAGAVVILCALMSLALFRAVYDPIAREVDAKAMLQPFCREMESQDYARVYNYLSIGAKGRFGAADQFMNHAATLDRSDGIVNSCALDADSLRAAAVHSDGKRMDVGIGVSRGNSTRNDPNWHAASVTIKLVLENDAWKVDDAYPAHILF